uniref:Uncharacterized protein n=1 Tax=Siphoviridae sp. ctPAi1 TaxID=2826320 RepID=A0A8S5M8S7_9CAUD|nr:MAG TPA: hypothetical protein [Siphoviridae sp. ctPAi1]
MDSGIITRAIFVTTIILIGRVRLPYMRKGILFLRSLRIGFLAIELY